MTGTTEDPTVSMLTAVMIEGDKTVQMAIANTDSPVPMSSRAFPGTDRIAIPAMTVSNANPTVRHFPSQFAKAGRPGLT